MFFSTDLFLGRSPATFTCGTATDNPSQVPYLDHSQTPPCKEHLLNKWTWGLVMLNFKRTTQHLFIHFFKVSSFIPYTFFTLFPATVFSYSGRKADVLCNEYTGSCTSPPQLLTSGMNPSHSVSGYCCKEKSDILENKVKQGSLMCTKPTKQRTSIGSLCNDDRNIWQWQKEGSQHKTLLSLWIKLQRLCL